MILGDVAAARKNVTLTMYNAAGEPVARYHLTNAWPAKLEINGLKAGAGSVLLETVTLDLRTHPAGLGLTVGRLPRTPRPSQAVGA